MPSLEQDAAPGAVTAAEVLTWDDEQVAQFARECRMSNSVFDMSRVRDVDKLSAEEQDKFGRRMTATMDRLGPFNPADLTRLLNNVRDGGCGRKTGSQSFDHGDRSRGSSTAGSESEENHTYERFAHDELLETGARPVMPFASLPASLPGPVTDDADATAAQLRIWLKDADLGQSDGWLLPVFYRQLEDWEQFRFSWQWDNRGMYACEEGFAGFLESQRNYYLRQGGARGVSDPGFEAVTRKLWKREPRNLETSGRDGFEPYALAVKKRLALHHFTEPFELRLDPRQQDARTNWIEYLAFNYWRYDESVAEQRGKEPRYRRAWEEFLSFGKSILREPPPEPSSPEEQLDATKGRLEITQKHVQRFIKASQPYRRCEETAMRMEQRAKWVLEQLPSFEPAPAVPSKSTKSTAGTKNEKKRTRDTQDTPASHSAKKRRQDKTDADRPSTPEQTMNKKLDTPVRDEELAVAASTPSSGLRRSQRRRTSVAPTEKTTPAPKPRQARTQPKGKAKDEPTSSAAPTTSRAKKRTAKRASK